METADHSDLFESVDEDEIRALWRNVPRQMSEDDTWNVVVVGMALDIAFKKTRATRNTIQ